MGKPIIILFIVLIVGTALYVAAGEVKNSLSLGGVKNALVWWNPPQGSAIKPGQISGGSSNTSGGRTVGGSGSVAPAPKPPTPPYGFTVNDLSPVYGKVQVSGIHRGTSASDLSSFTLRASGNSDPIDVTGWKIKMYKGSVTVPRGVPRLTPSSGWTEENISLTSGDSLIVYSGRSPTGYNFRLNKCTGYLNQIYRFTPALPNNCPNINRDEITGFSGECQTLLLSLNSCRVPTPDQINSIAFDSACRSYIDRINYSGCYTRNRTSADFFSREWRAWVLQDFPFDKAHDRILLFDTKGLLVDEYAY